MTARQASEIDPEASVVRVRIGHLVACVLVCAGALISWTTWSVNKLNSIEHRLEAMQSVWTINDQERQMNWLRQDNVGLKVRDAREVVLSRTP